MAELFFTNRKRQEAGRSGCSTGKEEDPITRVYGTAAPSTIPESTEWWKKQQRDLFAMSDDAELGLMQTMATLLGRGINRLCIGFVNTINISGDGHA